MTITTAQRQTTDREVAGLAERIGAGIANIEVRMSAHYEGGGLTLLSLYHPGVKADGSDWSFVGGTLRPDGSWVL